MDRELTESNKKPYVAPELRHLGSVRQLTLGATGNQSDATSALQKGKKTSTRDLKENVHYLAEAERRALAEQLCKLPLATYTYVPGVEPLAEGERKLGVMIEDAPGAPFVSEREKQVDLYAFATAILATVQEQQRTIERLERELAALRGRSSS